MNPDDVMAVKLRALEHTLGETSTEATAALRLADKHEEQISGDYGIHRQLRLAREDNAAIRAEVAGLRRALVGFALTLPVAGVTFLLGILALVNH
jgi:hypothetical protein